MHRGDILAQRPLQGLGVVDIGLPEIVDLPAVVGLHEVPAPIFADDDLFVGRLQRHVLAGFGCRHDIFANRRAVAKRLEILPT
jgi:hypothetical protein